MQIIQARKFADSVKKLHKNQKLKLDEVVNYIISNPEAGISKIGDLSDIRVYKFKMLNQLTLLAYSYNKETTITLVALGTHENFYRDLKRH